jgi:hypothetical protein
MAHPNLVVAMPPPGDAAERATAAKNGGVDRTDFDYARARREEESRLHIEEWFALMVGRGELRTVYDPVERRLIYFNPRRGCPAFPWDWN